MACSPGMSQALARSPGLLVSTVLSCMVGAVLPPLPALTLFVGGLALMVVLCAGGLERPAVRLLCHARAFSEAEAVALAPSIALLCQKSIGPPVVELYARDGEGGSAPVQQVGKASWSLPGSCRPPNWVSSRPTRRLV